MSYVNKDTPALWRDAMDEDKYQAFVSEKDPQVMTLEGEWAIVAVVHSTAPQYVSLETHDATEVVTGFKSEDEAKRFLIRRGYTQCEQSRNWWWGMCSSAYIIPRVMKYESISAFLDRTRV